MKMKNLLLFVIAISGCSTNAKLEDTATPSESVQSQAEGALNHIITGINETHERQMDSGETPGYFPYSTILSPIVTYLVDNSDDFADINHEPYGYKIYQVQGGWMQRVDYREKGAHGIPENRTGYFIARKTGGIQVIGSVEYENLKEKSQAAERDRLNAIAGAKATIKKNFPTARIR